MRLVFFIRPFPRPAMSGSAAKIGGVLCKQFCFEFSLKGGGPPETLPFLGLVWAVLRGLLAQSPSLPQGAAADKPGRVCVFRGGSGL